MECKDQRLGLTVGQLIIKLKEVTTANLSAGKGEDVEDQEDSTNGGPHM